jgi:hypothetical protein
VGGAAVAAQQLRPPAVGRDVAIAPTATAGAPPAPAAGAVDQHSTSIARTLINHVPSGYQAIAVTSSGEPADPPVAYTVPLNSSGAYRAITLVRISDQRGSGMISAVYGNDLPGPGTETLGPVDRANPPASASTTDACSTNVDLGIEGATHTTCTLVMVDAIPVRLVTATGPGGAVMSATRYLRGGYVVVAASQSLRTYGSRAALSGRSRWRPCSWPGGIRRRGRRRPSADRSRRRRSAGRRWWTP